jgi:hypothetical protein
VAGRGAGFMIWWVLCIAVAGLGTAGIWFAPRLSCAFSAHRQVEAEPPCAFGFRMAWVAVRTRDTARLINVLGLDAVRSVGWSKGIAAVYDDRVGLTRVFITPPVDGWSFVVGFGLPLPMGDAYVDKASGLIECLSDAFGAVAYFVSCPGLDFFGWARAEDGRLLRSFAVGREGAVWNRGAVTEDERAIAPDFFALTEVGASAGAGRAAGRSGPRSVLLPHGFCETEVLALARAWSVDPTELGGRRDLDRGIGYLAAAPRDWRPELRVGKAA